MVDVEFQHALAFITRERDKVDRALDLPQREGRPAQRKGAVTVTGFRALFEGNDNFVSGIEAPLGRKTAKQWPSLEPPPARAQKDALGACVQGGIHIP